MEEKSNEDYTPIKYKLTSPKLGLDGFYEYTKIGENKIKLRKITCETKTTDEENCKPVVIDLNKKTRYIKFLKDLLNRDEDDDKDDDDKDDDKVLMTDAELEKHMKEHKYLRFAEQGGKRKTRRHRKKSKKNKSRSSKKRKSNKKKRKTVKKRRLRKQK